MNRFLAGAAVSLLLLAPSMTFAQSANTTQAQLQAQIAQLLKLVASLQQQLQQQTLTGGPLVVPVSTLNNGTTTPTVSIPGFGGQTYAIGNTLSGNVHVTNGIAGERICLSLTSNDLQLFAFPTDQSCTLAINAQGDVAFSGTIISQGAYNLTPGTYHLRGEVYAADAWNGGYGFPLATGVSGNFTIAASSTSQPGLSAALDQNESIVSSQGFTLSGSVKAGITTVNVVVMSKAYSGPTDQPSLTRQAKSGYKGFVSNLSTVSQGRWQAYFGNLVGDRYLSDGGYNVYVFNYSSCNGDSESCDAPGARVGTIYVNSRTTPTPPVQPGSITVTAPNGGEQWQEGVLNSVTWSPYNYNPDVNPSKDVTAYLERSAGRDCGSNGCGPEGFITLGKVEESGKASIHWITGELNSATYGGNYAPTGSGYYIRVVNNKTGAWDRSDKPFTLLQRPIDLKVNGSDGVVTIADVNQPLTVSWVGSGVSTCQLSGLKEVSFSTIQPTSGSVTGHLAYSFDGNGGISYAVSIECVVRDGNGNNIQVSDYVPLSVTSLPTQRSSLTVTSPNGGDSLWIGSLQDISWKQTGLSQMSVALYKNDQWLTWINKSVGPDQMALGHLNWNPKDYTQLYDATTLGNVYKIYITGQKSDGSGYIDDKSDAPFRFIVSPDQNSGVSIVVNPASGSAPLTASFAVTGAPQSSYNLDFGDGTSCSGSSCNLRHTYSTAGTYRAVVSSGDYSAWVNVVVTSGITKPSCPLYNLPRCATNQHLTPSTTDANGCTVPGQCVANSLPSCTITTDKSVYNFNDTVNLSWTTPNATGASLSLPVEMGSPANIVTVQTYSSYRANANLVGTLRYGLTVRDESGSLGTCSTSVTVNPSQVVASASIDQNSLYSPIPTPTLTGSANVSPIGISIDNGDKEYGSGWVSVFKDRWSVTVSPGLPAGTHNVNVYNSSNVLLTSGRLTINLPTSPTTSPTPPVAPSTVASATLDQGPLASSLAIRALSGSATGTNQLTVIVYPTYNSDVTSYRNNQVAVAGGRWSVLLSSGVLTPGTYTIEVHNSTQSPSSATLLTTGQFTVASQSMFQPLPGVVNSNTLSASVAQAAAALAALQQQINQFLGH